MIINSVPVLKIKSYEGIQDSINFSKPDNKTKEKLSGVKSNDFNLYLDKAELICIIWFTSEYLLRIYTTPNRKKFLLNILNAIDLLSILPYFISLALQSINLNFTQFNSTRRIISLLRIMRIVRLFKLARNSTGIQILGLTILKSFREIGMLVLFLLFSVIMFACLIFFSEHEVSNTQFRSIPDSLW